MTFFATLGNFRQQFFIKWLLLFIVKLKPAMNYFWSIVVINWLHAILDGHHIGGSPFQIILRSFPIPTNMEKIVLPLSCEIFQGKEGRQNFCCVIIDNLFQGFQKLM